MPQDNPDSNPGRGPPRIDGPPGLDEDRLREIRDTVSKQARDDLLDYPNAHGTGVGPRYRYGQRTNEAALIVYVEEKVPEDELDESERIPKTVEGQPTDVRELDPPEAQQGGPGREVLERPVCGGHSVGHYRISAGTGSPLLEDSAGEYVIVTNRHIAADDDPSTIEDPGYTVGEAFHQPGPSDHIDGGEQFGTVKDLCDWDPNADNTTDSALVDVSDAVANDDVSTRLLAAGDLVGFEAASTGNRYVQFGHTTGLTSGRIEDIDYSTIVTYNGDTSDEFQLSYDGLLRIEGDPSAGGDSGSIWGRVDPDTGDVHMIAVHFASGGTAAHISEVETEHGTFSPVTDSSLSTTPSGSSGLGTYFEATVIVTERNERGQLPVLVGNTGGTEGAQTVTLSSGGDIVDERNVTIGYADAEIVKFDISDISTGFTSFTVSTEDQSETAFGVDIPPQTEFETVIRVRDEIGAAVSGANVTIGTETLMTGDDGEVTFWLAEETYDVDITHSDYVDTSTTISVSQNDSYTVTMDEAEETEVAIDVFDSDGLPISSATVRLEQR